MGFSLTHITLNYTFGSFFVFFLNFTLSLPAYNEWADKIATFTLALTFRMVIVSSELFQVDPTQSFNEEPTMFSYVLRKHADLSSL